MTQFSVYQNANKESQARFPLLLDVQSGLISDLSSRVVIPLSPLADGQGKPMQTLMPICSIAGRQYVLFTPQLAGIPMKQLGEAVADLSSQRDAIVAALDLLITGY